MAVASQYDQSGIRWAMGLSRLEGKIHVHGRITWKKNLEISDVGVEEYSVLILLKIRNSARMFRSYLHTYLLIYLLTYSIEQSPPWEANRPTVSQQIPRIIWNPNVHYRIHNSRPPVLIQSQINPVHTPTSHFLKIYPNIIHPSTTGFPKLSLSFRFPHQNPVYISPLPHTCYMPRPSYISRFHHPNNIGWGVRDH